MKELAKLSSAISNFAVITRFHMCTEIQASLRPSEIREMHVWHTESLENGRDWNLGHSS